MIEGLSLRKANLDDTRLVYNWRFSSRAILNSWSQTIPEYAEHESYFLKNIGCYSIIMLNDKSVGFVRDMDGDISIVVDMFYRGRGIGSEVLKLYSGIATIRYGNLNSFYCFLKSGWKPVGWVMKK